MHADRQEMSVEKGLQMAECKCAAYPVEAVLVFARVGKTDVLEGQNRRWQLVTVWELEVEGALMLHWGSQTSIFHLIKNLLLALGLLHQVRVCSCSRYKPFRKCWRTN